MSACHRLMVACFSSRELKYLLRSRWPGWTPGNAEVVPSSLPLAGAAHPVGCLEAYCLQRTRFESIVEESVSAGMIRRSHAAPSEVLGHHQGAAL